MLADFAFEAEAVVEDMIYTFWGGTTSVLGDLMDASNDRRCYGSGIRKGQRLGKEARPGYCY